VRCRRLGLVALVCCAACGGSPTSAADPDAGALVLTPVDDATQGGLADASADAPQIGFITKVVSFTPGACAGYVGGAGMPRVVYGPPVGEGLHMGSTDVVSLGNGGEIVVAFTPDEIVDGPGDDFIVFENPFDELGGGVYAEPGEVSVSNDLEHWSTFPCTQTTQALPDGGSYGQCAGVTPVLSNPDNDASPFAIPQAGGDPYDLGKLGVKTAKYVRIRDVVIEPCSPDADTMQNGFDLDAIAVVNGSVASH
jgi:hypothetical protein